MGSKDFSTLYDFVDKEISADLIQFNEYARMSDNIYEAISLLVNSSQVSISDGFQKDFSRSLHGVVNDLEKMKNMVDVRCMLIRDSMVSKLKSKFIEVNK